MRVKLMTSKRTLLFLDDEWTRVEKHFVEVDLKFRKRSFPSASDLVGVLLFMWHMNFVMGSRSAVSYGRSMNSENGILTVQLCRRRWLTAELAVRRCTYIHWFNSELTAALFTSEKGWQSINAYNPRWRGVRQMSRRVGKGNMSCILN